MSFRRTASSLLSLPKFFGVDVVVFCEGGQSLSVPDAMSNIDLGLTIDLVFWKTVVDRFADARKFHFKSVGSKPTLRAIAEDVERLAISHITVCLDSDYDRVLGRALPYKRVAYTCGYGWENDVCSYLSGVSLLTVFLGPPSVKVLQEFRDRHSKIERSLAQWTETDIALVSRGKAGIFDRAKPLACVEQTTLTLREEALRSRLSQSGYKRRPKRVVSVRAGMATQIAFGKLISRLFYHLLIRITNGVAPKTRIDYDILMKSAIFQTFSALSQGKMPELANHYESQRHAF